MPATTIFIPNAESNSGDPFIPEIEPSPGLHISPKHNRDADIDMVLDWSCNVVKTLSWDPEHVRWLFLNGAKYVVLRHHPISEQKADMAKDPFETGKRHARELIEKFNDMIQRAEAADIELPGIEQFFFESINEPWLDAGTRTDANYYQWLDETKRLTHIYDVYMEGFTITMVDDYNAKPAIFLVGVGWPPNLVEGGDVEWTIWFPITLRLLTNPKYASMVLIAPHAYWSHFGPAYNGEWWAYRWKTFPREFEGKPINVMIWIGEAGLDELVRIGGLDFAKRGWKEFYRDNPKQYAIQIFKFYMESLKDNRFVGFAVFTSDEDFKFWFSFDLLPVYSYLLEFNWPSKPEEYEQEEPEDPPEDPSEDIVVWPAKGVMTQRFGENIEYYSSQFGSNGHNGIDIGANSGSPVYSFSDGIVDMVEYDENYGKYIRIFHPALGMHSFYAHLNGYTVNQGEEVGMGDKIGIVGNTGNSTGPHLHFELRMGERYSYNDVSYGHSKGRFNPEVMLHWLLKGSMSS